MTEAEAEAEERSRRERQETTEKRSEKRLLGPRLSEAEAEAEERSRRERQEATENRSEKRTFIHSRLLGPRPTTYRRACRVLKECETDL